MTSDHGQRDALEIVRTMLTKIQTTEKLIYNRELIDVLVGLEADALAVCEALEDASGCYGPDATSASDAEPAPVPDAKAVAKVVPRRMLVNGGEYVFSPERFRGHVYETAKTMRDYATLADVLPEQISVWCNGKVTPTASTLNGMAKALGVPYGQFIDRVCEKVA